MSPSALMHSSSVTPPASCRPVARLSFPPLRLLLLGLLLFILATPLCAAATTYYISPSGNDNNAGTTQAAAFKTIQQGINNASSSDTVTLAAGTYTGPGNVDLDMGGQSLTVNSVSGDPSTTILDCGGTSAANHRAFYFHSSEAGAVISGLTIKNCYENSDYSGGAVFVLGGAKVTLSGCTFTGNTVLAYGGRGGSIYNGGTLIVTNCNFSNNAAPNTTGGGAGGGGVFSNGTATLMNCNFSNNTSASGGGVSCSGTATLMNCTFTSNTSSYGSGGGVSCSGVVSLTNCTFSSNAASYNGGGLFAGGPYSKVSLTNCTLNGNMTYNGGVGGGIYDDAYDGTLTLMNCTVGSNTASSGGGIYTDNDTIVFLAGCILTGNTATNGNSGGIGVGFNCAATLTSCLLMNNTATNASGGGISNTNSSRLILQFCTLVGNSTSGTGTQGGALENDGMATLTDDILWGNTAPYEPEIGTPISGNPVTTVTYSDIQGGLRGTGNIHIDPLFVNAASDFHLQPGSPSLQAGTPITGVTTDLDGNTRPNPPSIGAYDLVELAALSVPSPVPGGTVVMATVTLDGVAPTDTVVGLSSSDSSVVRVFRAVIVHAGSQSATFAINTYRSHVTKTVTIQASEGSLVLTAPLTITGR